MNHLLTCKKTGTTCTMDNLQQCNSKAKKSQRLGATPSSSNRLEEEKEEKIDRYVFLCREKSKTVLFVVQNAASNHEEKKIKALLRDSRF